MHNRGWLLLATIAGTIVIWQLVAQTLPAFILPRPWAVVLRFVEALQDGSLLRHSAVTVLEVVLGLVTGASLASLLGYLLAKSHLLERMLSPYLVASQAVPIVAIAPLLVIWFGPGIFSKVLICSLTVFFPVLVNTVVGLRAAPENLRDLMRSLRATRWQMLWQLELPSALPILLGGLRIGATLSVIGAIVGEIVGAKAGLGFLINVARGQYDTALVFVALFTLIAIAVTLYSSVILLERHYLQWRTDQPDKLS